MKRTVLLLILLLPGLLMGGENASKKKEKTELDSGEYLVMAAVSEYRLLNVKENLLKYTNQFYVAAGTSRYFELYDHRKETGGILRKNKNIVVGLKGDDAESRKKIGELLGLVYAGSAEEQAAIDACIKGYTALSDEAIEDLFKKNAKACELDKGRNLMIKYAVMNGELLSEEKMKKFGPNPGFQNDFFLKYRNYSHAGELVFSRPGFNKSGDQALVFVESKVEKTGEIFFLMKDGTRWNVVFHKLIIS
jgi:hypothetical protein